MMTVEQIRTVWAYVTRYPLATVRGMEKCLGIKYSKVRRILVFLEMAGYVKHVPRCSGRIVLMPLADPILDREERSEE